MSWSFSYTGKASKVAQAIEDFASRQTGNTQSEFDAIKDGIKALVDANFNRHEVSEPIVVVEGNGYGSFTTDGVQVDGICNINVKRIYTLLLE